MQRRLMPMGEREGLPRAPVHGREVRVQFRLLSRAGKRSRKPLNYGWEIDESAGRTTGGSNSLDCRAGRVRRRARVAIVDEWYWVHPCPAATKNKNFDNPRACSGSFDTKAKAGPGMASA